MPATANASTRTLRGKASAPCWSWPYTNTSVPATVSDLTGVTAVAGGEAHSLAALGEVTPPDTTSPTCANMGVVTERNGNGQVTRVYLKIALADAGSGLLEAWLTGNSTN